MTNVGLARLWSNFKVKSLPDTAFFICTYESMNVFVCVDLCCVIKRVRCRREETRHWHACLALVQHLCISLSLSLSVCGVVIIQHLPISDQALSRVLKSGLDGELAASCRNISMRNQKSAIRWSSRKNQEM